MSGTEYYIEDDEYYNEDDNSHRSGSEIYSPLNFRSKGKKRNKRDQASKK